MCTNVPRIGIFLFSLCLLTIVHLLVLHLNSQHALASIARDTRTLDVESASSQEVRTATGTASATQRAHVHQGQDVVLSPRCRVDATGKGFDEVYTAGKWLFEGNVERNASKGRKASHSAKERLASPGVFIRQFYSYASESHSPFTRHSLSGHGSDMGDDFTRNGLRFLSDVIKEYGVRTMLDVPCGDVNWQMESYEVDSLALYVGADVVNRVVELNTERFRFHTNKRFVYLDFAKCAFPQVGINGGKLQAFDLLHVRDALQHVSVADGEKAMGNIRRSGAKYLISTSFNKTKSNYRESARRDALTGVDQAYYINLALPPFDLKPIKCVDSHHPSVELDQTCLYDIS